MMGGVHLKRPDRFSSCASFDLCLIPYLIKQASLFHATESGVPREFVTVKTGEKPIQGPGNTWQLIAHDRVRPCLSSTSSPGPSHFLKEKPWGLGPGTKAAFILSNNSKHSLSEIKLKCKIVRTENETCTAHFSAS